MSNWYKSASVDDLVAEIKAIDTRITETNKEYSVWYADLLRRRISCVDELDARGEPISDYTKRKRRFPEKARGLSTEEPKDQTSGKPCSTKKSTLTDAQLAKAKRLYSRGLSIDEIADILINEEMNKELSAP